MHRIISIVLIIPLALLFPIMGCNQESECNEEPPEPGSQRVSCEGLPWDFHMPETCPTEGCGLILDVHGGGMSPAGEDTNTELSRLGTERGYIVAQPQGPWFGGTYFSPKEDDAIRALLERALAHWGIDETRVHMTGISLGGWATWRFACHSSDILASVAPLGAGGPHECVSDVEEYGCLFTADNPETQLSVLYAHGRDDVYFGWEECAEPQRDSVLFAYSMDLDAGDRFEESDVHTRTRWTNEGRIFEFIDYSLTSSQIEPISYQELGGHCVPGSNDLAPDTPEGQVLPIGCEQESPFHWGEEVAKFFEDHPKTIE
jgi:poly(3-hydroxybutyrate) depolymerase